MQLLVSDRHGIYVWQRFAEVFEAYLRGCADISDADVDVLLAGPANEEYWDAIETVERAFVGPNGETLYQDGDLWLLSRNDRINNAGEIIVQRYLLNPATGAVDTEESWQEACEGAMPDEWGGVNFDDAGLVEVTQNIEGENGYDPACGAWRPVETSD